mmetsp:Transcript_8184/g.10928  ORF Transcript_8184/g.10928 Transcript_8184/m.10928 type:complete len:158 (-) Transcript_8184:83-556(-)|eukprot:CAMPEP_0201478328 /NCGR_PEP_ID=MMETSP0151_2-20130828/3212_1 /ASSEMBLY_ACC=CAM_ASM_000257 /TAXON_ID=200890 /ORGANISM="Paramoeba atlantica, Strain 621/1 / CCAP 1560/9" /LENGTH=157 /DNA_ID=CAMNT_0047859385 /DNA_START=49 /DNA_END=522 /DNA_ORIENTATION=+
MEMEVAEDEFEIELEKGSPVKEEMAPEVDEVAEVAEVVEEEFEIEIAPPEEEGKEDAERDFEIDLGGGLQPEGIQPSLDEGPSSYANLSNKEIKKLLNASLVDKDEIRGEKSKPLTCWKSFRQRFPFKVLKMAAVTGLFIIFVIIVVVVILELELHK